MSFIIKEIAEGKTNEEVHDAFIKFSKGVFPDRYLLEAKKVKEQWNIKTSNEYVNLIVKSCLSKVREEIIVTGAIVATFDVSKEAGFTIERIKQFMGIKQAIVNTKITPDKIINLMEKFPRAFYALSFSTPDFQLKVKAKAPKSAKPAAAGDKEIAPDFCSLKTKDENLVRELLFDVPTCKVVSIRHTININEIELPNNENDPVKLRENAVRVGVINRKIIADEKEIKREYKFRA